MPKSPIPKESAEGERRGLASLMGAIRALQATPESSTAGFYGLVRRHGHQVYEARERVWGLEQPVDEVRFSLANPPPGSPWRFSAGTSHAAIIAANFAPIATHIPTFIAALQKTCIAIFGMVRAAGNLAHRKPGHFLVYVLDRGSKADPQFSEWIGGPPLRKPAMSKRMRLLGLTIPEALKLFYQAHSGFGVGDIEFGTSCVFPAKQLRFFSPAQPGLVECYCDDGGNRKLMRPGGNVTSPMFDWDRSTHELSREGTLWNFLERDLTARALGVDVD